MLESIHQVSYVFLGLCAVALVAFWYPACRIHRRLPLDLALQMWRLQSRSWRGVGLTSSLYLAIGYMLKVTIWPALGNWLPPVPVCFVLGGVLSFVGYSCLPPTVLFLTTSQSRQKALAVQMIHAFRPYRVVFLLSDDLTVGVYDAEDFSQENLRTPDDVDWRHVVHPLIEIVPIVVIDTRDASPAVIEESIHMLAPERCRKAVFMTTSLGESPVLNCVVSSATGEVSRAAIGLARKVQDVDLISHVARLLHTRASCES
jgi:hypothetical protein